MEISGLTYLAWGSNGGTYNASAAVGDYFIYSQFNSGSGYSFNGADIVGSCSKPSGGGYNQYEVIVKATATTVTFICTGNYMISKLTYRYVPYRPTEKVSVEVRVTNANPYGDRQADLYVNGEHIYRICTVQKSDPYFPPSAFGPEDFPRE